MESIVGQIINHCPTPSRMIMQWYVCAQTEIVKPVNISATLIHDVHDAATGIVVVG